MIPAHIPDLEVLIADPVGTGPWMHDRTDLNVETVLVKNPNYFRTDPEGRALPFLDGMTWTQFTGFELWLAALKTGQTQMVDHFHGPQLGPPEVREDLANAVPGIVFDYYIQTQYGVIFANRPPFDDARVREAIFLWLDRKQILDLDTGGVGSVFGSGVTPTDLGGRWGLPEVEIYNWPGLRYVDASGKTVLSAEEFQAKRDELQKHPDDLARAKELLAEAGIAPGSFSTTIIVQGGGVQDRVGPVVAQQLSELFESSWELKISTDASVFWTQHIFQGDWKASLGATMAQPASTIPRASRKTAVGSAPVSGMAPPAASSRGPASSRIPPSTRSTPSRMLSSATLTLGGVSFIPSSEKSSGTMSGSSRTCRRALGHTTPRSWTVRRVVTSSAPRTGRTTGCTTACGWTSSPSGKASTERARMGGPSLFVSALLGLSRGRPLA